MMLAIDTLFGLPAHPLVVHAAVILLPIAAISLIVVAAIPKARRIYAPIVFAVALFATIAVFMAQESGESLEAIAVTIMSAVVAAEPYARGKLGKVSPHVVTAILVGGSLIVGIGATWTVVEVGHSGAKSVWSDVSKDG
jgi:energy-converting hydrogenase Eha subunit B